jgi:hypothetical protein
VWDDLADRGEAVKPGKGLAGAYLHKLVDLSDRAFTLKEVVEKFWRDPVFPMVTGEADVRSAIFDSLKADEDGVAWELIDSTGALLVVESPDQLAIGSSEMHLRVAAMPSGEGDESGDGDNVNGDGPGHNGDGPGAGDGPGTAADEFSVYDMSLDARSLSDPDYRNRLYLFLSEVTDVVDPSSGIEVELASVQITFTAATSALDSLSERAEAAGVTFVESDEDF